MAKACLSPPMHCNVLLPRQPKVMWLYAPGLYTPERQFALKIKQRRITFLEYAVQCVTDVGAKQSETISTSAPSVVSFEKTHDKAIEYQLLVFLDHKTPR